MTRNSRRASSRALGLALVLLGLTTASVSQAGVDYLIIADSNLVSSPSLQNLANYHASRGLTVSVVDVSTIGATPDQIKAYIQSVYLTSTPRDLDYVLLVGSTLTIPHKTNVFNGEPSEAWYSWLEGNDMKADIALGRLPALTSADLDQMITKTLNFHNNVSPGTWRNRALLVAAPEANFQTTTSEIVNHTYRTTPPVFTVLSGTDPANFTNSDISNQINSGALIVNYRGHGSPFSWANWNSTNASFTTLEASTLTNGLRTPIVFSFSCDNLNMDNQSSLGEAFVRQPQGAVAFMGSIRTSDSAGNTRLNPFLFRGAWDEGFNSLGYLYNWSLREALKGAFSGTVDASLAVSAILGDPALQLFDGNKMLLWDTRVDDDMLGGSSGSGDQTADAGETIELSAYLLNTFNNKLTSVTGVLSSTDPNVSIGTSPVSFGDPGRGERIGSASPFTLSIDPNCPDGHRLALTLAVTGTPPGQTSATTWTLPIEVVVRRQPIATVSPANVAVTLSSGETRTINLSLQNTGAADLGYSLVELAGQDNPSSMCPSRPYRVAILNNPTQSSASYFPTWTMNNYWEHYKQVLEADPQGRFVVTIVTDLQASTLAQFDRLILPGNVVPDIYLDSVENWLTNSKRLIAVGDAIAYAAYSGMFWPGPRGNNGRGDPPLWLLANPGTVGHRILTTEKATEGYSLTDLVSTKEIGPESPYLSTYIASQTAPSDAILLTEWNQDVGKIFAAERKIPGKGTMVVLGGFPTVFGDGARLVRNAVEGEGDLTWLSIATPTGTVSPRSQGSLSLTVSAAGVGPGTYRGYVRVYSNATHRPLFVPIDMTVSGTAPSVSVLGTWVTGTTHAKEAAANRALVVNVYGESSSANMAISSVKYGGQTMTKVVEKNQGSTSRSYVGSFLLNESGIAAATSASIAVTWTSAPSSGSSITSVFLSNVNQAAPVGTTATGGADSAATVSTGALANAQGDMVLLAATAANNGTYVLNNGFIRGGAEQAPSWGDVTAGYKPATGTGETPSVTMSTAMRQSIVGFVVKSGGGPTLSHTITASAGANGVISPSGTLTVTQGSNQTFTMTPNAGYVVSDVTVDGASQGAITSYTFNAVSGNHTISASFRLGPSANVALLGSWVEGSTHAKEPGAARGLVVLVYAEGTGDIAASGVTYGGRAMTKVVEKSFSNGTYSYTGAFFLAEAGVAAATTGAISVTWSKAPTNGSSLSSVFLANVNQAGPLGSSASNALTGATVTTSALATSAGDMVIVGGTAGTNGSYTVNNAFTRGFPETSVNFGDVTAAYKQASGGSEVPSLTHSSGLRQTIVGFVVKK